MAAKATIVKRIPQAHTFVLSLGKDTDKDTDNGNESLKAKGSKGKKIRPVTIAKPGWFWKGVRKGDVVQFVPNTRLTNTGATVKIVFHSKDGLQGYPLKDKEINSSAFHLVVSNTRKFKPDCHIRMADGTVHGYVLADGPIPCTKIPC
jgi:hypothetical protein